MKLTVTCQECGGILLVVEKDVITDEDIQMYEDSCSCEKDGQDSIQGTKTCN